MTSFGKKSDYLSRYPAHEGMGKRLWSCSSPESSRGGTLPNFLYQREIVRGESVNLTGDVHRSEDEDRYETCSNVEEEEIDEEDESQSVSTLNREANFLLGAVPTFSHAVWFNSRLIFC